MSLDTEYRENAAAALCQAIADCDRQDALQIMSAAVDDLGAGYPEVPFADLRSDAAFWADTASPAELESYFVAALATLPRRAMGIRTRKRLFMALWNSFPKKDQEAFLKRIKDEVAK